MKKTKRKLPNIESCTGTQRGPASQMPASVSSVSSPSGKQISFHRRLCSSGLSSLDITLSWFHFLHALSTENILPPPSARPYLPLEFPGCPPSPKDSPCSHSHSPACPYPCHLRPRLPWLLRREWVLCCPDWGPWDGRGWVGWFLPSSTPGELSTTADASGLDSTEIRLPLTFPRAGWGLRISDVHFETVRALI